MSSENLSPLNLIAPESLALDAEYLPLSIALSKVLMRRRSSREFGPEQLPLYKLSRLLWAACGINRPERGLRTAPSSSNGQQIDIYAALPGGLYRYAAFAHQLLPVLAEDLRAGSGGQDYVARAPLNLIYVATFEAGNSAPRSEQLFYAALDTGFISQNVYLFCAAEGLATVVRSWIDRGELAGRMGLTANQHVIAAQSIGFHPDGVAADVEVSPIAEEP